MNRMRDQEEEFQTCSYQACAINERLHKLQTFSRSPHCLERLDIEDALHDKARASQWNDWRGFQGPPWFVWLHCQVSGIDSETPPELCLLKECKEVETTKWTWERAQRFSMVNHSVHVLERNFWKQISPTLPSSIALLSSTKTCFSDVGIWMRWTLRASSSWVYIISRVGCNTGHVQHPWQFRRR